jgi:predicted nucleic-acid-binding protein
MIGLDTNLLVRYLTRDDPAQFGTARIFIEQAASHEERLFINTVVLCELTWVLESAYGYTRAEIGDVIERILATAQFEIEHVHESRLALADFNATRADYADALIGRINRLHGATRTVTFDRDLKALDTFDVL